MNFMQLSALHIVHTDEAGLRCTGKKSFVASMADAAAQLHIQLLSSECEQLCSTALLLLVLIS